MEPLEFLLYVDEKYVESLYKYYYENVIETTKGKTKNGNKKMSLVSKLFKSFPIECAVDTEISLNNVSILESKIQPSVESKISHILNDKFKNELVPLVDLVEDLTENGIFYFQGVFELLSLENKNGTDIITSGKYKDNPKGLMWKLKLITYDEKNEKNVLMALGGDKILVNYHHLTEEIEKYKRFPFNILGKISKLDNKNFTVKPIVIFYM